MTLQTGNLRRAVKGAVASGAMAVGLLMGIGASTALADPADPTTETETPPMTADQVLAIIDQDYDTGAGGGKLSQLIHQVMLLRSQGFKPSNANRAEIEQALEDRPNQTPLIEALTNTLHYQRKLQAQAQNANADQQPGFNFGGG